MAAAFMARNLFANGVWCKCNVNVAVRGLSSQAGRSADSTDAGEAKAAAQELPEEPTDCCMSGCANCVWIAYAEQLSELLKDGGQHAREAIADKVKDPSMKMFLLMELKATEEERSR